MTLSAAVRSIAKKNPLVRELRDKWRAVFGWVPAGHFYSPIPDLEEVRRHESRIFAPPPRTLPGIDLREDRQTELVEAFAPYYAQMPFQDGPVDGLRYQFDNPAYSYADAIFLHCMIRHVRPKRIVEIGSGFSSCMTLDTNALHFDGRIRIQFIEPYPQLLQGLLLPSDDKSVEILPCKLQDVDPSVFSSLEAGDILFIDSTHVSKIDSDVNRILFEILPSLRPGVIIHFHDIFHPFEYPRSWIYEHRAWNEAYALRAFLQYNNAFQVELMSTFLAEFHKDLLASKLPLCLKNPGASIWLRKV